MSKKFAGRFGRFAERCVGVQLVGNGGARAYLAVAGGLDVPPYLGSRATFPAGKLGGTQVIFPCPRS